MVLERLYSPTLLMKGKFYDFILGFSFAIFGMAAALVLFPEDPALVALTFISLLLLPSIYKLLNSQEEAIVTHKSEKMSHLLWSHKGILSTYLLIFLGIFFAFGIFAIILPNVASSKLFEHQVEIFKGINTDYANFGFGDFWSILSNNIKVLTVLFLVSFLFGTGDVFIITWNASVFGTTFGLIAKSQALTHFSHPIITFFLLIISIMPHMIAEACSYFLGGISGGILSTAITKERIFHEKFGRVIKVIFVLFILSLIFIFSAAYIESNISPLFVRLLVG